MFYRITIFLLTIQFGFGQVVNVEQKRLGTNKHFAGNIEVNFTLTQTEDTTIQLGNQIHLQYNKKKNTVLFLNQITFLKDDDEELLNEGLQHLRHNYDFTSWLTSEIFFQSQYSKTRKIDWRGLLGGGPRFTILNTKHSKVISAHTYMAEYIMYDGGSDSVNHRYSTYLSAAVMNKTVSWNNIVYYQPRVDQWKDYRVSFESSLKVDMNKYLYLKIIYNLTYETEPFEGLNSTYQSFVTAVGANF